VAVTFTPWNGLEPPSGSIAVEQGTDGPVMYLRGDVDGPVVRQMETEQGFDGRGIVAVDVSGLSYIDSTGLSMLVRFAKDAGKEGRPAVIRGATARFNQVLEVAGLASLFVRED